MPRRLILSEVAISDLAGIARWQGQPGAGRAATRRVRAIRAAISALVDHPCRWRAGDYPGTRRLVVADHVVIYTLRPDTGRDTTAGDVLVLRVFGPGQSRET